MLTCQRIILTRGGVTAYARTASLSPYRRNNMMHICKRHLDDNAFSGNIITNVLVGCVVVGAGIQIINFCITKYAPDFNPMFGRRRQSYRLSNHKNDRQETDDLSKELEGCKKTMIMYEKQIEELKEALAAKLKSTDNDKN